MRIPCVTVLRSKNKRLKAPICCIHALSSAGNYPFVNTGSKDGLLRGTLAQGDGIAVSQYAELHRTFTERQVQLYSELIGDMNPIHLSTSPTISKEVDARPPITPLQQQEGKIVVHGMLTASLFSSIFGTLIPGSIYRCQKLTFKSLVFCNDFIVGMVHVNKVSNLRHGCLVTCNTHVTKPRQSGNDSGVAEVEDSGAVGKDGDDNSKDGGRRLCEQKMEECVVGEAQVWLPGVVGQEGRL